ncbi:hypothetical protein QE152_g6630 [Popillia japonica]|uniref:Uncharacterized protein n=1 Tax=Popillia japonica TaxID=7064 RepID=A0AAW1MI11_POPJA
MYYKLQITDNDYKNGVLVSALADHYAQKIAFSDSQLQKESLPKIEKRLFGNHVLELIKQDLSKMLWQDVVSIQDVNSSYAKFNDILMSIINKHSKRRITTAADSTKAWLTPEIRRQTLIKRQLYEGVVSGRICKNIYKHFCDILKNQINESKKKVHSDYIENSHNKMKATWKIVNEIQGRKKQRDSKLNDFIN